MNDITPQAKASFRSRMIVAAILIAIMVPAFILGGWVFFGIVAIYVVLAVYEMIHASGKKYPWYIQALTYLIVFCYVYWFVFKGNFHEALAAREQGTSYTFSLENYFQTLDISIIGIGTSLALYFFIAILDKRFTFEDASYFFLFTILLGLGFQAAFFCRYYPFYLFGSGDFAKQTWYLGVSGAEMVSSRTGYPLFSYLTSSSLLFFVLVGTCLNDTGAYVIGSLYGKHHMNERVSPHKTWEGFFGGWVWGSVSCLAFGLALAYSGYPMLPTLSSGTWYWIVLLSLTIPLISDLGDLSFSLIKRHFGIKDYGSILKGHGGIVDRVGSCFFTCMYTAIILVFITNGWNFFL